MYEALHFWMSHQYHKAGAYIRLLALLSGMWPDFNWLEIAFDGLLPD